MTDDAIADGNRQVISNFIIMLQDVVEITPDATLSLCIADLQHALENN